MFVNAGVGDANDLRSQVRKKSWGVREGGVSALMDARDRVAVPPVEGTYEIVIEFQDLKDRYSKRHSQKNLSDAVIRTAPQKREERKRSFFFPA
jgi:hypothetical protein